MSPNSVTSVSFRALLFISIAFFACSVSADHRNDKPGELESHGVCSYPVSGQYAILQRVLYYALLIFSVLMHGKPWLVGGALAAAMTYSGAAAVHALVLAGISTKTLLDLDIYGVWAILSAGVLAVEPMMTFSTNLRNSVARPVVAFWGMIIGVGTVGTSVAIWRNFPIVPGCFDDNGIVLGRLEAIELPNCSYVCEPETQILRVPDDIEIIHASQVFGHRFNILMAAAIITLAYGVGASIFAFGLIKKRKGTEAEIKAEIQRMEALIHNRYVPGKIQGWHTRLPQIRTPLQHKKSLQKKVDKLHIELEIGEYQQHATPTAWISPILFPVVIILNEVFILSDGGLPSLDPPYVVAQWAPWISVVLALIAAIIVHVYEPRFNARQAQIKLEVEAIKKRNAQKGVVAQGSTDTKEKLVKEDSGGSQTVNQV
jgi:hypothetical protein